MSSRKLNTLPFKKRYRNNLDSLFSALFSAIFGDLFGEISLSQFSSPSIGKKLHHISQWSKSFRGQKYRKLDWFSTPALKFKFCFTRKI